MIADLPFSTATSAQIEKDFCGRLERIRLSRNITQKRLAEQAGVSLRTVRNLEQGAGVSFDTVLRVMTALGVQSSLPAALPDPAIRPIERVERRGAERKRASTRSPRPAAPWAWGDGKEPRE